MKKTTWMSVVLALVIGTSAFANDNVQFAGFESVEAAFASQQAELEQLRTRLASFEDVVPGQVAPASYDSPCCGESCCVCPGWTAAADILFLTGKHSDLDVANRFDADVGYRVTLGYDDGCGSGVRLRYMDWDASEEDDNDNSTLDRMEVESLDLEFYTGCEICCNTSIEFSAGVRYFEYLEDFDIAATTQEIHHVDGWGPMVGLEVSHCLNDSLSIFGLMRESIVGLDGNRFGDEVDNEFSLISELQVGAEYTRCTCNGTWFARAALEAQSYGYLGEGNGYDAGLFGGTLSVGLHR